MDANLLRVMAQLCHFAQEHVCDPNCWDHSKRWDYFTCVDYQIACLLAQNTVLGSEGVECNIVLDELEEIEKSPKDKDCVGVKSIDEWERIIQKHVDALGGWRPEFATLKRDNLC